MRLMPLFSPCLMPCHATDATMPSTWRCCHAFADDAAFTLIFAMPVCCSRAMLFTPADYVLPHDFRAIRRRHAAAISVIRARYSALISDAAAAFFAI